MEGGRERQRRRDGGVGKGEVEGERGRQRRREGEGGIERGMEEWGNEGGREREAEVERKWREERKSKREGVGSEGTLILTPHIAPKCSTRQN